MLVVLAVAGVCAAGWLWLQAQPRGATLAQTPPASSEDVPPPILPGQPTIPIPVPEPPLPAPHPVRAVAQKPISEIPSRELFASAWKTDTHAGVAEFNAWAGRYLAADDEGKRALLAEGVTLAQARRAALSILIKKDPRAALAAAVPLAVRAQLPPEIAALLEERVAGVGQLALLGALGAPGQTPKEPLYRTATVNEKEYRAYTFGRRETQATRQEISIIGVAVENAIAVSESPLRVLETGETPAPGVPVSTICPISGNESPAPAGPLNPTPKKATAVQVAGKVQVVCHVEHVAEYEQKLIAAENAVGPYGGALSPQTVASAPLTLPNGQPGTSGVGGTPPVAWTTGVKKVLIIRVDFSDLTGEPMSPATGLNVFNQNNGVGPFYQQCSYGLTSINMTAADISPLYRMPQTANAYAVGGLNGQLHNDARAAATAGGYNVGSYDRVGVVFKFLGGIAGSQIDYGGLGQVGGPNFWVNGFYDFRVVAHELGHTWGLFHCDLWQVYDGNPISPNGVDTDYADPFGVMSAGNTNINFHFDQWQKSILHWIPDTSVPTITVDGTYRLYRFDHANANTANTMALKIVRNAQQDYWIGFRQLFPAVPNLFSGAYILWGYNYVTAGDLLDMTTPGSNPQDAGLAIGQTFHDTVAGITIRPLAKGGVTPNEYLDVQIQFDPLIEWLPPVVSVEKNSTSVTLTAKLHRTATVPGPITVNYATANGTATAPAYYTAQSGVLTWPAGDSSAQSVIIPIVPNLPFVGVKTFTCTLSNQTPGVLIDVPICTVNIGSSGTLDTSFDSDFVDNAVYQTVLQPDGKLLIGGAFTVPNRGIARMNPDGTVDTAFGVGGGVDTLPVFAVALQPDGKILIGGDFTDVDGTPANRVARLNADGTVDTTFNLVPDPANLGATIPGTGAAGAGDSSAVRVIVVQPDGKIVVGGSFTTFNDLPREYLVRLNPDGSVDPTFVGPDFSQPYNWKVSSLALQPDNKILVGGRFFFGLENLTQKSGIIRVLTNGALDPTFITDRGASAYGNPGWIQEVRTIALQRNGQIVIGGDFNGFGGTTLLVNIKRNRLARLNTNGSLDAFNPNVDGNINYPTPASSVGALFIQADGNILVGGEFASITAIPINSLARLGSGGSVDASFNVGTGSTGEVFDITMQANGRAVFGTGYGTIQGIPGLTVGRLFTGITALPGLVQFSAATAAGAEGGSLNLTATRTGGSFGALTMNYATQAGTAAATRYTPVSGTLSWADGDTASKTVTVPLLNDALTEPDQTFALNLGIPIGGTSNSAPWQTTITITDGAPLGLWRLSKFTPTELLDAGISGATADIDHDGLSGLLEYAYGLNPKVANTTGAPVTAIQTINGSKYLTLTFRRSPTATDLIYTPQSGGAINVWNGAPVLVGTPITNADGTQTVTFRDSVPITPTTGQRFIRLQVTRTP